MKRIVVVGCPGVGKSTLSDKLSETLDLPVIELDAYFHQPGWTQAPRNEFRAAVFTALDEANTNQSGWITAGNYNSSIGSDLQQRADTIIWLDLPRRIIMPRIIRRTLRRVVSREELWNGNREPWTNLYSWDPEKNIIRWSWTQFAKYRQQYEDKQSLGAWDHATVHRLCTSTEVERFAEDIESAASVASHANTVAEFKQS